MHVVESQSAAIAQVAPPGHAPQLPPQSTSVSLPSSTRSWHGSAGAAARDTAHANPSGPGAKAPAAPIHAYLETADQILTTKNSDVCRLLSLDEVKKLADTTRDTAKTQAKLLSGNAFALAADPTKPHTTPAPLKASPVMEVEAWISSTSVSVTFGSMLDRCGRRASTRRWM